jgi:peptidyl-prolyl cis-trans isomerase C
MKYLKLCILFVVILAWVACSQKKGTEDKPASTSSNSTESAKPPAKDVLAEIDGTPITKGEFLEYIGPYPDRMKESVQGKEYVIQAMIDQVLLEGEAKKRGLDREPAYVAKVDAYRRNLLNNRLLESVNQAGFEVSVEDAKKYFEENPEEFDRPERVNVRHILVATVEQAKDLLSQVRKGASFEKLAREHSQDNFSKERGGELGAFNRKQRPDLAEAAFAIKKPGGLTGPVKTKRGFHILQLVARFPAQKDKFEKIRDSLINRLRARRRQDAKKQLLSAAREKAQIKVNQQALEKLEIK